MMYEVNDMPFKASKIIYYTHIRGMQNRRETRDDNITTNWRSGCTHTHSHVRAL